MLRRHSLLISLFCLLLPLRATGQASPGSDAALIALARSAVASEVTGAAVERGAALAMPARGVFVTIERHGQVVGCRGTLAPRYATMADEIIAAARSAAGHDPRYTPLTPSELKDYRVTVTLVERLEPINAGEIAELSPGDGLVLTSSGHIGVVLPWEGRDPVVRLRWAYKKAGVSESSPSNLKRMIARRFRG